MDEVTCLDVERRRRQRWRAEEELEVASRLAEVALREAERAVVRVRLAVEALDGFDAA